INNNFSLYIMIGAIFELEDENGNYPANGSMNYWIGYQNLDTNHGTQVNAGPEIIDNETTHHRFNMPNWSNYRAVEVRRAVADLGNDEDSETVLYQWEDLTVPSTGTHSRLSPGEAMEMTNASGYNNHLLG